MSTNLVRIKKDQVIAGVCSGLAHYFDVDPILVRAVFIITILAGGAGIVAYLLLWVIMPEERTDSGTENAEQISTTEQKKEKSNSVYEIKKRNGVAGLVLVLLGSILLIENLFPRFNLANFWPILLIGFGIWLVWRKENR